MRTKVLFSLVYVSLLISFCSCGESHDEIEIESLSLNIQELNLNKGETEKLIVTINPANASDKRVVWISDNEDVAKVSYDGEVNALNAGTAVISVSTLNGNKCVNCIVKVRIDVESIALSEKEMTLRTGEVRQLKATVLPMDASNKTLIWKSADTSIATVDSEGQIKGISKGSTTIIVMAEGGGLISDTCMINVITPPDSYNGYECVDLGLPSGTLWAKCNIGAKSEEEAGTYFYWGEITDNETGVSIFYIPQSTYTDEDGFTHTDAESYKDIGENIQNTEYDAAHMIMGGNWMLPEEADVTELKRYTTREEVEKNGVKGFRYTADNGNYIFIPAVGGKRPNGTIASYGQRCCITIATSNNPNKYAGYWGETLNSAHGTIVYCEERSFRHQVRGIVREYDK